jgi:hypothetical protein
LENKVFSVNFRPIDEIKEYVGGRHSDVGPLSPSMSDTMQMRLKFIVKYPILSDLGVKPQFYRPKLHGKPGVWT